MVGKFWQEYNKCREVLKKDIKKAERDHKNKSMVDRIKVNPTII